MQCHLLIEWNNMGGKYFNSHFLCQRGKSEENFFKFFFLAEMTISNSYWFCGKWHENAFLCPIPLHCLAAIKLLSANWFVCLLGEERGSCLIENISWATIILICLFGKFKFTCITCIPLTKQINSVKERWGLRETRTLLKYLKVCIRFFPNNRVSAVSINVQPLSTLLVSFSYMLCFFILLNLFPCYTPFHSKSQIIDSNFYSISNNGLDSMSQEATLPILHWLSKKLTVLICAVNRQSAKRLYGQLSIKLTTQVSGQGYI